MADRSSDTPRSERGWGRSDGEHEAQGAAHGTVYRPAPAESTDRAEGAAAGDGPDVYLNVPLLNVQEISLEVENLEARVSLNAGVFDLLKLNVGADVALGRVNLEIKGVEAQALLEVKLDNVALIVDRVLTTLDRNPEVLRHIGRGAESAARGIGVGAGEAVGELGQGAGEAVEGVGRGAGEAVEGVGRGAGEAVETVGEGAGDAAGELGKDAGGAVRGVGESSTPLRAVAHVAQESADGLSRVLRWMAATLQPRERHDGNDGHDGDGRS